MYGHSLFSFPPTSGSAIHPVGGPDRAGNAIADGMRVGMQLLLRSGMNP
jgi:hypothetical protein